MRSLLVLLLFYSTGLYAETLKLTGKAVEVEEMYVEYRKVETLRDPYYDKSYDERWNDIGEFRWTANSFNLLFWENNLHLRIDNSQVRHVGWEYTLGIRLTDYLDVVKYHHSQHCTECVNESRKFPVEDSYGMRVYLILGKNKKGK